MTQLAGIDVFKLIYLKNEKEKQQQKYYMYKINDKRYIKTMMTFPPDLLSINEIFYLHTNVAYNEILQASKFVCVP